VQGGGGLLRTTIRDARASRPAPAERPAPAAHRAPSSAATSAAGFMASEGAPRWSARRSACNPRRLMAVLHLTVSTESWAASAAAARSDAPRRGSMRRPDSCSGASKLMISREGGASEARASCAEMPLSRCVKPRLHLVPVLLLADCTALSFPLRCLVLSSSPARRSRQSRERPRSAGRGRFDRRCKVFKRRKRPRSIWKAAGDGLQACMARKARSC
jgi:hypothetical protein